MGPDKGLRPYSTALTQMNESLYTHVRALKHKSVLLTLSHLTHQSRLNTYRLLQMMKVRYIVILSIRLLQMQ